MQDNQAAMSHLLPPTTPRWRKVLRDIWGNKSRTTLVVLAIAVGVFAFGGMFMTRDVLIANMNYAGAFGIIAGLQVAAAGFFWLAMRK